VQIENCGRGLAEKVRVCLALDGDGERWVLPNFIAGDGWRDARIDGRYLAAVLELASVLYPYDSVVVGQFAPAMNQLFEPVKDWRGVVRARIDAKNMQPIEFEASVPSAKNEQVTYPKDDA
jgi:hypothetical protein